MFSHTLSFNYSSEQQQQGLIKLILIKTVVCSVPSNIETILSLFIYKQNEITTAEFL